MNVLNEKRWQDITREERYFTSFLFHDLLRNHSPFLDIIERALGKKLPEIKEIGYEVCFFRDKSFFHKEEGLEPCLSKSTECCSLRKLTFDLALFLDNRAIVIIEAKAHEGFNNKQLRHLVDAKKLMTGCCGIPEIYFIGLHSSGYKPIKIDKTDSKELGMKLITWNEIANNYSGNKDIYLRANKMHRDEWI
ncbi:MAG: hypothetical protein ABSG42_02880 [Nitrospirota bacterium]